WMIAQAEGLWLSIRQRSARGTMTNKRDVVVDLDDIRCCAATCRDQPDAPLVPLPLANQSMVTVLRECEPRCPLPAVLDLINRSDARAVGCHERRSVKVADRPFV